MTGKAALSAQRIDGPCTWCGSAVPIDLFQADDRITGEDDFIVSRCQNCRLVYTRRRPPTERLVDYYPVEYYNSQSVPVSGSDSEPGARHPSVLASVYGYPASDVHPGLVKDSIVRFVTLATRRDASWVPWVHGGRLLDVGAGRGAIVRQYAALGWDSVGVEPGARAVELARAAGLDIRSGTLEDQGFPSEAFDAVILNHVLEHVPDVAQTLREVRRVLKNRGWLLVRVPNSSSFDAKVFGRDWFAWEIPRHLSHFEPQTLRFVLEQSGFEVVRLRTEFRPGNMAHSALYAAQRRKGVKWSTRRFTAMKIAITPINLFAAWLSRSPDMAVLARAQ